MDISIINLLLLSISLSVDSFSIILAIGSFFSTDARKEISKIIFSFSLAHFLMLLIGWAVGSYIAVFVEVFASWIIFGFLGFIGGKLIFEAINHKDELEIKKGFFRVRNIIFLSLITSLDALAIGFSFALLNISILIPSIVISVVVGLFSLLGFFAGGKLSKKFPDKMKIIAGIVLILIGLRQLLEHFFSF
jgi:putative Mn2+ efflux pump MntP